jgi:hypothetical protein
MADEEPGRLEESDMNPKKGDTTMKLVPAMTRDLADRLALGLDTLYLLGQPYSRKLRRDEMAAYEAAKVNHYVVTSNQEVSNAYFNWCEGDPAIPFVRVKPKKRYAEVSMDLITIGSAGLHPEARREVKALWERFGVPPYASSACVFSYCDRIKLEDAEHVAAALWTIATTPRPSPPGSAPPVPCEVEVTAGTDWAGQTPGTTA